MIRRSNTIILLFILVLQWTRTSWSQSIFNKKGPALPSFNPGVFNKKGPSASDFNPGAFEEAQSDGSDRPIVSTDFGILHGRTYAESHAFYSVPYAVPPVGTLRFEPPKKFEQDSSTVVNASVQNYIACQQIPFPSCDNGVCITNVSEDCLVLNIFVPSSVLLNETVQTEANLPVMVFFHGGYFYAGSGTSPIFNGKGLSNHTNTIVVTVNYRLGPLGFLYYDDLEETIQGNQGLSDQRLALNWVQDNIEKFGGNKSMVTIFGESAGAQSVMFHLISNESAPLFTRAIVQSNPALISYNTKEESKIVTEALMDTVNCTSHTIECLRNVSAEDLVNALPLVINDAEIRNSPDDAIEPFRPLIDGHEFSNQPLVHFDLGIWNTDKEVMMGVNAEELAFLEQYYANQTTFNDTNDFLFGSAGNNVTAKYVELAENTKYEGNYSAILAVEESDAYFVCPTRAMARFVSKTSETGHVYLYNNTYPMSGPSCIEVVEPDFICGRSFHTAELVFVFRSGSEYGYEFSEADTIAADLFSRYWGNFAYFGDPDPTDEKWTKYESDDSNHPNLVIKATDSVMSSDYRGTICDFWDTVGVYPSLVEEITTPIYEGSGSYPATEPSQIENTTSGAETSGLHCLFLYICFALCFCILQLY